MRYTVRQGDTLLALSAKYLTSRDAFRAVQQLNRLANPNYIPVGSTLLIPDELLRTEPILGEVTAFRGDAKIDGQAASVGAQVREGMRVETGPNAFIAISLPDGSAISLPSQSRITVARLRRILLTGGLDRNFRLEAGRSRSTVSKIKDPTSNFRVTTPLSVAAVRGTDFRIGFEPETGRALTEVVGGLVAVATDADKNETEVPKSFGTISTAAGTEPPVALLPGPQLVQVEKSGADGVLITAKPVDGAVRYRTQLATDVGFLNVIQDAVNDAPSATFTGLGKVGFFVRLTAIAASGLEGIPATYTNGRRIDTPDLSNSASLPQSGHNN